MKTGELFNRSDKVFTAIAMGFVSWTDPNSIEEPGLSIVSILLHQN
jgi:hypothetical protein